MKHHWRISGKKILVDDQVTEAQKALEWKVLARPGGWLIAERVCDDGTTERIRGFALQVRGKLSAQWNLKNRFHGPHFGEWVKVDSSRGSANSSVSAADFTAQFPGKVRKILVSAGENVVENQKLLLVEAMKMEFAVQAPVAGTVKTIRVIEGQQLSPGDLMLDFEPSKSEGRNGV